MFENERELDQGLELLSANLRQGAPAEVKARLQAEFRRHISVRRRTRWGAFAATAIASALVLWQFRPMPTTVQPTPPPVIARATTFPAQLPAIVPVRPHTRAIRHHAPRTPVFIAFDDNPVESGLVVRVNSGGLEADVLLGEDGQAQAVRFLR